MPQETVIVVVTVVVAFAVFSAALFWADQMTRRKRRPRS